MSSATIKLRKLWLQVHKWVGLLLAMVIIPVSVTGSALVWHDGLDEMLNPERVVGAAPSMAPSAYAKAARGGGERLGEGVRSSEPIRRLRAPSPRPSPRWGEGEDRALTQESTRARVVAPLARALPR